MRDHGSAIGHLRSNRDPTRMFAIRCRPVPLSGDGLSRSAACRAAADRAAREPARHSPRSDAAHAAAERGKSKNSQAPDRPRPEPDRENNLGSARKPVRRLGMVGVAGLEPTTPCPPDRCATGLRYTPKPLSGSRLIAVRPGQRNPFRSPWASKRAPNAAEPMMGTKAHLSLGFDTAHCSTARHPARPQARTMRPPFVEGAPHGPQGDNLREKFCCSSQARLSDLS